MFFVLSKTVWFFFQPSNFIVFAGLIGAALTYTRRWVWGRRLVTAAIVLLAIGGLTPLGQALVLPLEQRFPPPAVDTEAPDGIIVLGGTFDTLVSPARGEAALNESAERLTTMVGLAKRYPNAKIVFSGGAAHLIYAGAKEADVARGMLVQAGLDSGRLILEDRSRNTFENALYTRNLIDPAEGERWMLVTSAYHMPRAMGCFRRVKFAVIPYPVDYRTRGPQDLLRPFNKVSEGLRRVDLAVHEWVGLIVYWLTGRTSELFPSN